MAPSSLKQQISSAFATVGHPTLPPPLLSQITALSTSLRLSPTQLAEAWEAHSLTKSVEVLNDVTFGGYRSTLAKEHGSVAPKNVAVMSSTGLGKRKPPPGAGVTPSPMAKRVTTTTTPATTANTTTNSARNGLSAVDNLTTPSGSGKGGAVSPSGKQQQQQQQPTPGSAATITPPKVTFKPTPKYSNRTNSGQLVTSYNPHNLPTAVEVQSSKSTEEKERIQTHVACTISPHPLSAHSTTDTLMEQQQQQRHMFAPLEKRSGALEDRLASMNDAICKTFQIKSEDEEMVELMEGVVKKEKSGDDNTNDDDDEGNKLGTWVPVGLPKQNKVLCVGRICNEAHEGRLNRASIRLEGSRQHSAGSRIQLDLQNLNNNTNNADATADQQQQPPPPPQSYSFFPGQIVAVEGINSSGRIMQASRLLEGVPPPKETMAPSTLLDLQYGAKSQNGAPLSIVTMCGPYTTKDNLDYDPLVDAIVKVAEDKPDVVILCGPFVDARHPQIGGGRPTITDADGNERLVSYETLFATKISSLLEEMYDPTLGDPKCKTQFVLVPSMEDAFVDSVYPQVPFEDKVTGIKVPKGLEGEFGDLGLKYIESAGREDIKKSSGSSDHHQRVHCVSNPCTLQINDVTIGITSTDVLFHISSDECNANLEPGTRLSRIAQHLIQQRSYYPLFPAAKGASLDLTKSAEWEMAVQPDILIVPSKLASFARKVCDTTVVVNPGELTKNITGGTYAVMDVHPMKREVLEKGMEEEEKGGLEKGVHDRVRVDIRRI